MVAALVDAEIPVMGHLGLTPQSVHVMGGFTVQAREAEAARTLLADARALQDAGCFAIVLEGIPDVVAGMVTEAVDVPTVGIGAGPWCDGQVLVFHDLLGLEERKAPKFVRRYASLGADASAAVEAFAADVRAGRFPADAESYHLKDEVAASLWSAAQPGPAADAPEAISVGSGGGGHRRRALATHVDPLDVRRRHHLPDGELVHSSSPSHPRAILDGEMSESQTSTTMIRFQPPLLRTDRGPGRRCAGSRGR